MIADIDPWDTMIPLFSAPSLALSDTFSDSPSYCSETDKNNVLWCGQRAFPVERSRVHGVQGVGLAPQTQEGSAVSHSQGGVKAGHLCSLSDPSPSINNRSITVDPCTLVGGMSRQHVGSKLFNWHVRLGFIYIIAYCMCPNYAK